MPRWQGRERASRQARGQAPWRHDGHGRTPGRRGQTKPSPSGERTHIREARTWPDASRRHDERMRMTKRQGRERASRQARGRAPRRHDEHGRTPGRSKCRNSHVGPSPSCCEQRSPSMASGWRGETLAPGHGEAWLGSNKTSEGQGPSISSKLMCFVTYLR
jgi:hypothetical protein